MKTLLLIIASYLIGSISFAMLIAKANGIDLRKVGSGNLGATNLSRACGKNWAYVCFLLDTLKGVIPAFCARYFLFSGDAASSDFWLWLAVGAAAILGHVFPFYLKFKGGKGVATSFGVVLGIWPYYTLPGIVAFILWATIVLIFKYISLAAIISAAAFPFIMIAMTAFLEDWRFAVLWPLIAAAMVLCLLVIFLHRANIKRLIAGTEHKVLQKKSDQA
ncbi:MAG TPA: acyl-phosphate glycerol 3-phosphate acyltransferase [Phycisphaerales bacterium]|nr:MAG: acyl-phosphate glycerol 3-phosphate acyltransferase [Planctomycetes bacterium GWC2_45_44]HBG77393.1 acyl-phosphate glycerol 3-phosphate acyltransferase [Phycisphaerales bacterium]HBR19586.1 acyl-phosphate glycerol 3-phosphate acyltransferase [Phycisphaerales bacterium]